MKFYFCKPFYLISKDYTCLLHLKCFLNNYITKTKHNNGKIDLKITWSTMQIDNNFRKFWEQDI